MRKVKCPSCDERFELEEGVAEGEFTYCPSCYEELHIISLDPIKIEVAPSDVDEEEEDDEYGSDY